ncbi:MAG: DUF7064 domain-containing protein [Promethearchaeota archaeon]
MEPLTHSNLCTDHPEWNESYYFVFFNKEHDLGGMSRIGFKPNKPEGMTFVILFLPDGSAAISHHVNDIKNYSNLPPVGGMVHECQPDGKWIYEFQGKMTIVKNPKELPKMREQSKLTLLSKVIRKQVFKQSVKMSFKFNPINDVYEFAEHMTPESLEIGKKAGDKHWEQIAKISGEIQIGKEKYLIENTIGQRDHTYGVRDWTGINDWFYFVVWFNENLAINPAAVINDEGKISSGGFIFKDGKNIPLKTINILEQKFEEDGIFPISTKLELIDNLGDKHLLNANVGPIVPVPFQDNEGNKSILVQSFGSFELDGITGGYGSFETLRKVKNI